MSSELGRQSVFSPTAQSVHNTDEPIRLDGIYHNIQLEVLGQGTIAWKYQTHIGQCPPRVVTLKSGDCLLLVFEIPNNQIEISGPEAYRFRASQSWQVRVAHFTNVNLLHFDEPCKYLWISINKDDGHVKFGHGYMLECNTLVRFQSITDAGITRHVLKTVSTVELDNTWSLIPPMKYWRLPVVRDPPHLVINDDSNTMSLLDSGSVMLASSLPVEAYRLYSAIRSTNIGLENDQIKWINRSLVTTGCRLHQTIKAKDRESNVSRSRRNSYIRVGMGAPLGDSIGDKFVLEIWPVGHESAVHSHGDAAGIIKVLHGSIEVSFYNPLVEERNGDIQPIKTVVLKKGDITFLTPEFYQTHKLCNLRRDTASVTMQCYCYMSTDTTHRERFDYRSEVDNRLHQFEPRRDFDFEELINIARREYESQMREQYGHLLASLEAVATNVFAVVEDWIGDWFGWA